MEPLDPTQTQRFHNESPSGLIITAAHVGNNDVVGAAIAHMGLPLNVVADDSAFPELFEYLREQREQWPATLIPWRNLRRSWRPAPPRAARAARRLGLSQRRDPGKLFDAWTTLPAGPATLAAKT